MKESQEMWVQPLDREDLLEEERATHSSIFAWRIPWIEEPGRLTYSPRGCKESVTKERARTHTRAHTHTHVRNIELDRQFNLSIGFPGSSDGKESACKVGDPGSIPELGRSIEEGKATHSSNLAWKIPWTKEPGGPQSMGLQRVRHD